MSKRHQEDLANVSMLELFRIEVENQTAVLNSGLLELERGEPSPQRLETLMRAAHSLKGAARIVNVQGAVHVAHAIEDCFVAAQQGKLKLCQGEMDVLLQGVDLLSQLSRRTETDIAAWETEQAGPIKDFLKAGQNLLNGTPVALKAPPAEAPSAPRSEIVAISPSPTNDNSSVALAPSPPKALVSPAASRVGTDRVVRLTAENLNRLLGLAGESLVESRWLGPFAESLQRLKRQHVELSQKLDSLRSAFDQPDALERTQTHLADLFNQVAECRRFLTSRLEDLDTYDRRSSHLSHRLYLEVLRTRMRPFGDGVRRFPRMVRDLARSLGKQVRLEITGEATQVDRDILERLEAPLAHLLRNAVDHGSETPEQRQRAGKPPEALIRLEARHSAGMLVVTVSDDGTGVEVERVRAAIQRKGLTTPALAEKMGESELLEFLFLPGFTLKETVTEISGRGVGLDVVQNMVKGVRGSIRITTLPDRGLRIQLQLPLTLSVLRALLVEVAGEPYAIPLSQMDRTLKVAREQLETLEGRHLFHLAGNPIGLLTAYQVLDCGEPKIPAGDLAIVVLSDRAAKYGLVVDRFLGERELVVQPLDPRLGKVKDISAAALMEDGAPVLILDVEDVVRSIETLVSGGRLGELQRDGLGLSGHRQKRVLAVDDSLTVRELERKLIASRGYLADVAVDGMDGWNAVRNGEYDLVITDVDMPRMDGIELARLIKNDARLKSVPVMIVSYKDREEDRVRGLEAGADYYLTKGSFHDETLLQAVVDLIGEPDA